MKPLHELDALCAEKVAGLGSIMLTIDGPMYRLNRHLAINEPGGSEYLPVPHYTTDPAAVLGLLEKCEAYISHIERFDVWYWTVEVWLPNGKAPSRGVAPTLALAGTLALLKAHGVETE